MAHADGLATPSTLRGGANLPPPLPSAPAAALDVRGRPGAIPLRGAGQIVFTVEELEAFLDDPVAARAAWEGGKFAASVDDDENALA